MIAEQPDIEARLARHATEYVVSLHWPDEEKSRHVWITRHSNHGNWIDDGKWVALIVLGPMNPHYLLYEPEHGWVWRYKTYRPFDTAAEAYQAVKGSFSPTESWETHP